MEQSLSVKTTPYWEDYSTSGHVSASVASQRIVSAYNDWTLTRILLPEVYLRPYHATIHAGHRLCMCLKVGNCGRIGSIRREEKKETNK